MTDHTLEYYAEMSTTDNKFGNGILCILHFKLELDYIKLTTKGHKGFGPADFTMLYDENALRSGENHAESTV